VLFGNKKRHDINFVCKESLLEELADIIVPKGVKAIHCDLHTLAMIQEKFGTAKTVLRIFLQSLRGEKSSLLSIIGPTDRHRKMLNKYSQSITFQKWQGWRMKSSLTARHVPEQSMTGTQGNKNSAKRQFRRG